MIKSYRNSRKAFTLIELLAVIVILAIIALIITPVITDVIKKARESSDLRSAEAYVKAAENYYAEATLDSNKASLLGTNVIDSLEVNNAKATGEVYAYSDGTVAMAIVLNNKCYSKTKEQYIDQIVVSDDTTNCSISGVTTISINTPSSTKVAVSSTISLSVTTNKTGIVTWNSSDTSIATVDSNGLVTGIGIGDVIITSSINGESDSINLHIYKNLYTNGTPVYFNVSTGKTCLSTEAVSTTNTKTGCMKFYTFNDSSSSSTVNMILDHNTTATNLKWAASVNTVGPDKTSGYIYYQLLQDTKSWLGVETQSNYQYTNSSTSYTVTYGTDNAKARFITANEIATITGNTSFTSNATTAENWFYFDSNSQNKTTSSTNKSKYSWLYDYTSYCTSSGCNVEDNKSYNEQSTTGYWTSDAVTGDSSKVWFVYDSGGLYSSSVTASSNGIRPVITVL